jgi:hypothetical protein
MNGTPSSRNESGTRAQPGKSLAVASVLLILISFSFCAAACIQKEGENRVMSAPQATQKDNFKLEVSSEIQAEKILVLRYTFRNGSSQNAYLFNQLYKDIVDGPMFETDANLLNVEVSQGGILLSKKIVPVPPDIDVEKPILPCTTLVKPGSEFSETISLPLPLISWTPYHVSPHSQSGQQPIPSKVWFELGYFPSNPQSDALVQRVRTKGGEAFYFDPFPIDGQKTLGVGPLPVSVPVIARP